MNKSKKGGNIWKFLGEHWYLVANIVIASLIIILTIVFFLEKPKKKNTQSKNTANSCQNNTEKYITDVVVSRGKKCPDGYYNVDITGSGDIKLTQGLVNKIKKNVNALTDLSDDDMNQIKQILNLEQELIELDINKIKNLLKNKLDDMLDTETKLCYKQPDTICKGDLIVTKLNTNLANQKLGNNTCQSQQCKKSGYNTECNYTYFNESNDPTSFTYQYPSLDCRCKSCGDVPVGHYDMVIENEEDSGNVIYNNKCAGNISPGLLGMFQMCMSQDEYGTNNTGISDIIYSNDKVDGYTNVDSTNIFFK
jgi:hypothetical protein